jgi:ribosome biogenesis GTPase A
LDTEHLASRLLEVLRDSYPEAVKQRYKLESDEISESKGYELLELIGRKRGMLISGGETDTERASIMVLDEFRSAKMGRITLEQVGK